MKVTIVKPKTDKQPYDFIAIPRVGDFIEVGTLHEVVAVCFVPCGGGEFGVSVHVRPSARKFE